MIVIDPPSSSFNSRVNVCVDAYADATSTMIAERAKFRTNLFILGAARDASGWYEAVPHTLLPLLSRLLGLFKFAEEIFERFAAGLPRLQIKKCGNDRSE
jgi:hypothetical protein